MNRPLLTKVIGLMGCCALVACVNLTPPWAENRDAGRPGTTPDSTLPSPESDAGPDGNLPSPDLPAPSADADQAQPAVDAPNIEDGAGATDTQVADAPSSRDSVADRPGPQDVRPDGRVTDARAAGPDAGADRRGGDGEAADVPVDASTTVDSASDVTDTSSSIVIRDAAPSPDVPFVGVVKLTGTTFGTGPAHPTHPTATFDKAFDDDTATFFDDSNAGGGYAGIDVGDDAVVSFIRYYPREGFIDRMVGGKFQCSATSPSDGYVDLFIVGAVPASAWTTVAISNAPACRYFRYLGGSTGHTNLGEIEFWATVGADGGAATTNASLGTSLVNLALGQPASASSEQTPAGKLVANGNDGLAATMFCPADDTFPAWYQVDLGDVYPIQQTDIIVENAGATYQYQIDVSLDGADWTATAGHQSDATGSRSTLTDDFQAQARHVRVTFTGASNGMWGCLREFMVWSPSAPPPDAGM